MSAIKEVSLYDLATGAIVACVTAEAARITSDERYGVVAGHHDGTKRRVNLATGEVEPYQPPAPDADHEWDAAAEVWVLPVDIGTRRVAAGAARAQILALEARQARALREIALYAQDPRPEAAATVNAARQALRTIDELIVSYREDL